MLLFYLSTRLRRLSAYHSCVYCLLAACFTVVYQQLTLTIMCLTVTTVCWSSSQVTAEFYYRHKICRHDASYPFL